MSDPRIDLERFYTFLSQLEELEHQGQRLESYSSRSPFPLRGVYFFREPGEYRFSKPNTYRIVRIGTHAVSANSKSTLWGRLKAHLGTRSGGGNHRGSIFRLHVGSALLAKEGVAIPTWGVGSSAPRALRESAAALVAEAECERKVSAFIGSMTVLWVNVPDDPGPFSKRTYIEQNAIALLSNFLSPLELASTSWLGNHSPRKEIRQSSLWNLNHVNQNYDPKFLDDFEDAVDKTTQICGKTML